MDPQVYEALVQKAATEAALIALADLTEFSCLGGRRFSAQQRLSNFIEDGRVHEARHAARLRALVTQRLAQLKAWYAAPDRKMQDGSAPDETTNNKAQNCISLLETFGVGAA